MRKLEPDVSKAVFSFAVAQGNVWAGQQDGNITVFANTNPPKFVTTFNANRREIFAMAYVDGSMWTGSADGSIFIWDPKKFKLRKTLKAHNYVVKVLLVIPERGTKDKTPLVLSGDVSGTVAVWRGTTLLQKFVVEQGQPINCVCFIEETQHVWLGTFKKVYVYSVMDWTRVAAFEAHGGIVSAMASSENVIWTSCSDLKALTAWDVRVRGGIVEANSFFPENLTEIVFAQKLEVIKEMNDVPRICCLAAVDNPALKQRHLWGGSLDNLIYVYSFEDGELVETLKGHGDFVYALLPIEADSVVWSGSRDCSVRTWSF